MRGCLQCDEGTVLGPVYQIAAGEYPINLQALGLPRVELCQPLGSVLLADDLRDIVTGNQQVESGLALHHGRSTAFLHITLIYGLSWLGHFTTTAFLQTRWVFFKLWAWPETSNRFWQPGAADITLSN